MSDQPGTVPIGANGTSDNVNNIEKLPLTPYLTISPASTPVTPAVSSNDVVMTNVSSPVQTTAPLLMTTSNPRGSVFDLTPMRPLHDLLRPVSSSIPDGTSEAEFPPAALRELYIDGKRQVLNILNGYLEEDNAEISILKNNGDILTYYEAALRGHPIAVRERMAIAKAKKLKEAVQADAKAGSSKKTEKKKPTTVTTPKTSSPDKAKDKTIGLKLKQNSLGSLGLKSSDDQSSKEGRGTPSPSNILPSTVSMKVSVDNPPRPQLQPVHDIPGSVLMPTLWEQAEIAVSVAIAAQQRAAAAAEDMEDAIKLPPSLPAALLAQLNKLMTGEEIDTLRKRKDSITKEIGDLRKRKPLPKLPEPPRRECHWDYLLKEMRWLSEDFHQERKWKLGIASKTARRASKWVLDSVHGEGRAMKKHEEGIKMRAKRVAKLVKSFWGKIERVVMYKQEIIVEDQKKDALGRHLDYLVGQTERYSTMLSNTMSGEPYSNIDIDDGDDMDGNIIDDDGCDEDINNATTDDQDSHQPSQRGVKRGRGSTARDRRAEIDALMREGEMPLEDLLKIHGYDGDMGETSDVDNGHDQADSISHTQPPKRGRPAKSSTILVTPTDTSRFSRRRGASRVSEDPAVLLSPSPNRRGAKRRRGLPIETVDIDTEYDATVNNDEVLMTEDGRDCDGDAEGDADGGDFEISEEEEDNEETLDEEEAATAAATSILNEGSGNEIDDLQKDAELSLDELVRMYGLQPSDDGIESFSDVEDETVDDNHNKYVVNDIKVESVGESSNDNMDTNSQGGGQSTSNNNEVWGTDYLLRTADDARVFQPTGTTFASLAVGVRTPVPFLLRASLREYQHIGLDWLVGMSERNLNGILADEMGLGKTVMTIALLAHLACEKGIWGPHLIVVPTSVMLNWEMELKRFCPGFKVLTYYGSMKERKAKRHGWSKPNAFHVCITSYQLVVTDAAAFRRKKWHYLILDEAHNIKNFKSQRWQTLLTFNSQRRLLLTGTPLQNNLMELWSLLHFLMPHVFQSNHDFKEWFSDPLTGMIEGGEAKNESLIARLHSVLRPFLLRRLKKDVELQLPSKIEHLVPCRLSKRQRFLYEEYMQASDVQATLNGGQLLGVLNVLMQLRKVCNHPDLFEERAVMSPFTTPQIVYRVPSVVCDIVPISTVRATDDLTPPCRILLPSLVGLELEMDHSGIGTLCSQRISDLSLSFDSMLSYVDLSDKLDNASLSIRGGKGGKGGKGLTAISENPNIRSLEQRLDEQRYGRLRSIAATNVARCNQRPIYGFDLRRQVSAAYSTITHPRRLGLIHARNDAVIAFAPPTLSTLVSSIPRSIPIECVVPEPMEISNPTTTEIDNNNKGSTLMTSGSKSDALKILPNRPLFRVSTSLLGMVSTCYDRMEQLRDSVNAGCCFYIPKVQANPAMLVSSLSTTVIPMSINDVRSSLTNLAYSSTCLKISGDNEIFFPIHEPSSGQPLLSMNAPFPIYTPSLRPVEIRRQVYFPDKRLLQYDCGKLQTLSPLLRNLKQGGHRVLIFTQMSKMLDILEKFLNSFGLTYVRLDGSTGVEQRQRLMERFNADARIFAFILSTRSGGIGVNLTGADTVIFYDSDWNPAMDQQAQDRCHRIGQTRQVHIYRLVSERTVEENILKKCQQKKELDRVALQDGGFTPEFFKRTNIRELFDSGADGSTVTSTVTDVDIADAMAAAEDDQDRLAAQLTAKEVALEAAEFAEETSNAPRVVPVGPSRPGAYNITHGKLSTKEIRRGVSTTADEEIDETEVCGDQSPADKEGGRASRSTRKRGRSDDDVESHVKATSKPSRPRRGKDKLEGAKEITTMDSKLIPIPSVDNNGIHSLASSLTDPHVSLSESALSILTELNDSLRPIERYAVKFLEMSSVNNRSLILNVEDDSLRKKEEMERQKRRKLNEQNVGDIGGANGWHDSRRGDGDGGHSHGGSGVGGTGANTSSERRSYDDRKSSRIPSSSGGGSGGGGNSDRENRPPASGVHEKHHSYNKRKSYSSHLEFKSALAYQLLYSDFLDVVTMDPFFYMVSGNSKDVLRAQIDVMQCLNGASGYSMGFNLDGSPSAIGIPGIAEFRLYAPPLCSYNIGRGMLAPILDEWYLQTFDATEEDIARLSTLLTTIVPSKKLTKKQKEEENRKREKEMKEKVENENKAKSKLEMDSKSKGKKRAVLKTPLVVPKNKKIASGSESCSSDSDDSDGSKGDRSDALNRLRSLFAWNKPRPPVRRPQRKIICPTTAASSDDGGANSTDDGDAPPRRRIGMPWLEEEDQALMEGVKEFGDYWTLIADWVKFQPRSKSRSKRSADDCRERYFQLEDDKAAIAAAALDQKGLKDSKDSKKGDKKKALKDKKAQRDREKELEMREREKERLRVITKKVTPRGPHVYYISGIIHATLKIMQKRQVAASQQRAAALAAVSNRVVKNSPVSPAQNSSGSITLNTVTPGTHAAVGGGVLVKTTMLGTVPKPQAPSSVGSTAGSGAPSATSMPVATSNIMPSPALPPSQMDVTATTSTSLPSLPASTVVVTPSTATHTSSTPLPLPFPVSAMTPASNAPAGTIAPLAATASAGFGSTAMTNINVSTPTTGGAFSNIPPKPPLMPNIATPNPTEQKEPSTVESLSSKTPVRTPMEIIALAAQQQAAAAAAAAQKRQHSLVSPGPTSTTSPALGGSPRLVPASATTVAFQRLRPVLPITHPHSVGTSTGAPPQHSSNLSMNPNMAPSMATGANVATDAASGTHANSSTRVPVAASPIRNIGTPTLPMTNGSTPPIACNVPVSAATMSPSANQMAVSFRPPSSVPGGSAPASVGPPGTSILTTPTSTVTAPGTVTASTPTSNVSMPAQPTPMVHLMEKLSQMPAARHRLVKDPAMKTRLPSVLDIVVNSSLSDEEMESRIQALLDRANLPPAPSTLPRLISADEARKSQALASIKAAAAGQVSVSTPSAVASNPSVAAPVVASTVGNIAHSPIVMNYDKASSTMTSVTPSIVPTPVIQSLIVAQPRVQSVAAPAAPAIPITSNVMTRAIASTAQVSTSAVDNNFIPSRSSQLAAPTPEKADSGDEDQPGTEDKSTRPRRGRKSK